MKKALKSSKTPLKGAGVQAGGLLTGGLQLFVIAFAFVGLSFLALGAFFLNVLADLFKWRR